jgi:wyosine [tRNA(Phe)-imidazoG37] synthetase (radical SAM superfamily)
MNGIVETPLHSKVAGSDARVAAFGYPRNFLGNEYVYVAISPRARGLSLGVNLNPDKQCHFDCIYCEVDRSAGTGSPRPFNLRVLASELEAALAAVHSGKLREHPLYARVPTELLKLRHVAISGDGEPTLCPQFREAVETVVHVRATAPTGFFKIVLITNASNLDAPPVQEGLRLLTRHDEIWAKLDGGTQAYLDRLNKPNVPLEKILSNILLVAKQRPVIIQSLFAALHGYGPNEFEIAQYAQRLKELRDSGAQIPLVQIYSATRPTPNSTCEHLPLRTLSDIARTVRKVAGLNAEVF